MTKETITFSQDKLLPFARAAFARSNRLEGGSSRQRRMSELSERVLEDIIDRLRPVAIVSALDGDALRDDRILTGEFSFHCPLFSHFNPKQMRNIYAFMLTVGEIETSLHGITATVFSDIWATVFCDAAVDTLSDMFGASTVIYPGFYGFELSNMPQLSKFLDSGRIGISVREPSCIMSPVKSCGGFMFDSENALPLPENDCENCSANKHWCIVCKNNEYSQNRPTL